MNRVSMNLEKTNKFVGKKGSPNERQVRKSIKKKNETDHLDPYI